MSLITFCTKSLGQRSAGKPHAALDVAGSGNVLHCGGAPVLDPTCEQPRGRFPRLTHPVLLTRNARDAERVMGVLPKRFGRYNLQLHPDKTCVTLFKPGERNRLDVLGFTHYWRRSRRGRWSIHRKTMKSRFARSVKAIQQWCRANRHRPLPEQHAALSRKVRGHYAYFGIRGNSATISRFRFAVEHVWIKWLRRRSHRHRLVGRRAVSLLRRYSLPPARLITMNPVNVMS